MKIQRREFLLFFGAAVSVNLLKSPSLAKSTQNALKANVSQSPINFKPVKLPIPLNIEGMTSDQQKEVYKQYLVQDDLIVPEGFTYDVIGSWGDPLGESRFGYNNDYLSYIPTGENEGLLTINFEYISGKTWRNTYPDVVKKQLPFEAVATELDKKENKNITASQLQEEEVLKENIQAIAKEALIDLGIGVIAIRRNSDGSWERIPSPAERRITGISGLDGKHYLQATGPGTSVFNKSDKLGYEDNLGSKIIGTFNNCAGGTTPWGTVLSAEENFQDQVPEAVKADGSALNPDEKPFKLGDDDIEGGASILGLAGNKYGWMVEVDPTNPQDYGTKHTWLGRFRHEAVAITAMPGKKLAVYSGCDRRGGHVYKFISQETVKQVEDKNNSRLFQAGMLYGAKFNSNKTGEWIPLKPDTPVNPVLPSQVEGTMVKLPNPDREIGGYKEFTSDAEVIQYQEKFKTLGDLYQGKNLEEKQGAILIDAHYAANAAGITCTARPEDTEVSKDGTLFIAFTSENPGGDGGPHKFMCQNPQNNNVPYEYGWIIRMKEDQQNPAAMTFTWEAIALGGEPASGGLGFSNPDNLTLDSKGHLWMVTDISTSLHNKPVPPSRAINGESMSLKDLCGLFGNNTTWCVPLEGPNAGKAYPFAIGPMETETCGLAFTPDETSLFLAIQHPGENNGPRENMNSEEREFAMKTTTGEEFMQKRTIPLGSNWPSKQDNQSPRPSVVVVRRIDGASII